MSILAVTREEFEAYQKVQKSGKYNMLDPRAREETNLFLNKAEWNYIIQNYSMLEKFFNQKSNK